MGEDTVLDVKKKRGGGWGMIRNLGGDMVGNIRKTVGDMEV